MLFQYMSNLNKYTIFEIPRVGFAVLKYQTTLTMRHILILHITIIFLSEVIIWVNKRHLECGLPLMQKHLAFNSVLPCVYTLTFHLVVNPLCFTSISIRPPYCPWAMELVTFEIPYALISSIRVISSIGEFPFAMEQIIKEKSFITFTIFTFKQSSALTNIFTHIVTKMPFSLILSLMLPMIVNFDHILFLLLFHSTILRNSLVSGEEESLIIKFNAVLEPLYVKSYSSSCTSDLTRSKI